ncbi:laminin subunit beta-1-like [Haliotis cracherodii]|uniref:laminin subunit beta-1-like n=1 Tax=Haliotis cracherodii TaxID=6455 RepID=UPI0039E8A964
MTGSDTVKKRSVEMATSLLTVGVFLTCMGVVNGVPVNVALNRPIQALYTCGQFGPESYYNHKDVDKADRVRQQMTCSNVTVHPPSAMVDGKSDTKWQSTNFDSIINSGNLSLPAFPKSTANLHAVIYIDLRQSFTVQLLILKLGDAKRPNFMAIHKSDNLTMGYAPWAYKVNFAEECQSKFSRPPTDLPTVPGDAVCSRYTQNTAVTFETIQFNFTAVPSELREWTRARYIRIEFYEIERTLSPEALRFQHFAISELEVMAECVCNGHATDCVLSAQTQIYECVCGGNTVGQFCERCLPFYNQKAWQYGVACEACNCFNHSTECTYSSEVETNNQSLNTAGKQIGGGQCINCQDNTAGTNCEKCLPNYFRPMDRAQTDPQACVLCGCNAAGSTVNIWSGIQGDCVMNNDTALPGNKNPGDCYCKANVQGTKCDQCKQDFYNLDEANSDGCTACGCDVAGTVGANQTCVPDATGQCSCKPNVQGRRCDTCKDGFYGLAANDSNGCSPCACDLGGASSPTCNKASGQCSCRPNIQGRKCDSVAPGYFSPDIHFIHTEFEDSLGVTNQRDIPGYFGNGYAKLGFGSTIKTNIVFPGGTTFNGTCDILIRYSAPDNTTASMQVFSNDPRPMTILFPACPDRWCYENTRDYRTPILQPSTQQCTFMVLGTLYLDRLMCAPIELTQTEQLLNTKDFDQKCDVVTNDMKNGTADEGTCKAGWFSLMSYYLNGPRSCDCSQLGRSAASCDPFGGQCQCKGGVTGRACDKCQAGFYQLTDAGCSSCNCASSNVVCDAVTGQCDCPPNTIGLRCDLCNFNMWGWNATTGCKECNCNTTGSQRTWCNSTTGVCSCKTGVQGDKCHECADTFTGFSSLGCSPCNCDSTGSNSTVCDKATGQCSCKANAEGLLCNQCKAGSFYLHGNNTKGCLDCVCTGITSQCSSSTSRQELKTATLVESSQGQLTPTVSVADKDGVTNASQLVTSFTDPATNHVSVRTVISAAGNVYWRVPQLTGSLLPVYGTTIKVEVKVEPVVAVGTPATAILIGRDKRRLVHDINALAVNVTAKIDIGLIEAEWKWENGSAVTRGQFLLALTNVEVILVPAAFTDTDHVSFLSRLEYSLDGAVGLVASSVEKCECGTGYTGLSCESCATGFKRANVTGHEYLGVCEPCTCNNHASTCDPNTGNCLDCQHQTTGANCEMCKPGYYGNATIGNPNDCSQCPCYDPRVVNTTCYKEASVIKCFCNPEYTGDHCDKCKPFHYGQPSIPGTGSCTACDCNNRTDICDTVTGICNGCDSNTTGNHCELCITGFYRNSVTNACDLCECNSTGSTDAVCDRYNGSCPCYPGVGGRSCNTCLDNYWGYSTSPPGCQACNCVEKGSVTTQCTDQGLCVCKANVLAPRQRCDTCVDGYFGLPDQECTACNCNLTGAVGGNASVCDKATGQCPCKPGVTGRTCDSCQALFIDFSDTGCKGCDVCSTSLGNDTRKLEEKWQETYTVSQHIVGIQAQDKELQSLHTQLEQAMTDLGLTDTNNSTVSEMTANITLQENSTKQQVEQLKQKVASLNMAAGLQKNISISEDARLNGLLTESFSTLDLAQTETQKGNNYEYKFQQYNVTAQTYRSQGTGGGSLSLNFSPQLDRANTTYLQITGDQSLQDMRTKAEGQAATVAGLLAKEVGIRENYKTKSGELTASDAQLNDLQTKVNMISVHQTQAQASKQQAEANNAVILEAKDGVNNITTEATASQTTAARVFSECQAIMSGDAAPLLPGVTLPAGVGNWTTGYAKLQEVQTAIAAKVSITDANVKESERKAQALDIDTQMVNDTFQIVRPRGEGAVNAITNFEKVILTLNTTLTTAAEARVTIAEAQANLNSVTIANLEAQANASKAESDQILAMINTINYQPEVLNSRLQGVNTSIQIARATWLPIDARLTQLQLRADILKTRSGAEVNQATSLAQEAILKTSTTQSSLSSANMTLANVRTSVNTIKDLNDRGLQLTSSVSNKVGDIEARMDSMTRTIEGIRQHQQTVTGQQADVNNRIVSIEAKLLRAKALLGKFRYPVKFNGSSGVSVTNPSKDVALPYTDVEFTFQKIATVNNALLFFSENTATVEVLSVEIVNNQVHMQFNWTSGNSAITSLATLCDDCWFRVQASRYNTLVFLAVTLVSTGGVAAAAAPPITKEPLTFNSPLYFGSLPVGVQTSKVSSRSGFEGCMYDVKFNGGDVEIWQESINAGNTPQCCRTPTPTTPTLGAGVSFDGFGQLVLNAGLLNITDVPLNITLKFRTFNPNAYLFLLARDSVPVTFGIYLSNGYIVLEIGTVGDPQNRIQTTNKFNTGDWFQVVAQHSTQNSLEIFKDGVGSIEAVTPVPDNPVDLTPLQGLDITFGSDKRPNSITAATLSKTFSGCMKDFTHSSGGGVVTRLFTQGVVSQTGVSPSGCPQTTISGIMLTSDSSFLELALPPGVISHINMDFVTTKSNGILMYIKDPASPSALYLTLFNGNLMLDYTASSQVQLVSFDPYLSDGRLHSVTVNLTSPAITVDSKRYVSLTAGSPLTLNANTPVFLGGTNNSTTLGPAYPVKSSFVGGIRNLQINGSPVNIYQNDVIKTSRGVDLSGIPTPPNAPPPIPYTTSPPPTTLPPPTCGTLAPFTSSTSGLWFTGSSYWHKNLGTTEKEYYKNPLSMSVDFQSYGSNGLLFLASDFATTPTQWLLIYLKAGRIHLDLKGASFTSQIMSEFTYNDGVRYMVDFLIYGTYAVLIENKRKDFVNNVGGNTSAPAIWSTINELTVGGVRSPTTRSFLTMLPPVPDFQGAIYEVTVHSNKIGTRPYIFKKTSADSSITVKDVFDVPFQAAYGVSLNGTNSYIQLGSQAVSGPLTVQLTVTNIQPSAMLFYVYSGPNLFVALDTMEYRIKVVVGSNSVSAFTVISSDLTNFCDGQPHTYLLKLTTAGVEIQVDSKANLVFPYPANFQMPTLAGGLTSVGGLHVQGLAFQTQVSRASMQGCVQKVVINGVNIDPTQHLGTSAGTMLACSA